MRNGVRYTKESLQAAASACGSIDDVLIFFEVSPQPQLRKYLLRRFAHYGIDTSHWLPRPNRRLPRPSDDELREAVAQSTSIAGVLRRLQRPDSASQRASLRKWTHEAGISTSRFLGQAHGRGKIIIERRKRPDEILVRAGTGSRTKTHLLRRALAQVGVPEQCAECGCPPSWRGKPITLEIDHINGDPSDNRPVNLRLLCPNCHAITATWCRGRGRRASPG
ncbi:HNH endonuclease signature motif containing protein [Streptomyces boninensis]|uniref:HNH endonuclease signature motif containing protein n=1 Tax=Streptomyces boninensis TaxID=2039455 RepID=UPI003B21B06F